jgi:small subunit ribosomal protein S15Ae
VSLAIQEMFVQLLMSLDSLNKTGVISPRYNVRLTDLEKWVVKLLPSRQFGYIVLTTSAGIMDHEEARRKHVAGKIIGFFY